MKSNIEKFDEIYKKYYSLILNIVKMKVGQREDAEDLCQEIFTAYYKQINNENIKSVKNWLLGVMRNHLYTYYKKHKVIPTDIAGLEYHENLILNKDHTIEIVINENILNDENFKDKEEWETFNLIEFSGFSFKAAANKLGLTIKQINYRYHNTIRRINYNLQKIDIFCIEDLMC